MVLHKEQKVLSDQVCSACHCIIQLGGDKHCRDTNHVTSAMPTGLECDDPCTPGMMEASMGQGGR